MLISSFRVKPDKSIKCHKLCCNPTHGIHQETEMEIKKNSPQKNVMLICKEKTAKTSPKQVSIEN